MFFNTYSSDIIVILRDFNATRNIHHRQVPNEGLACKPIVAILLLLLVCEARATVNTAQT